MLRGRGLEEFLPCYRLRSRWSDRDKEIERPLFPGYLFCRFDPYDRLPVLSTPGVVHIVGLGKMPIPVEEREVEAVRVLVRSGLSARPHPFLQVGNRVVIERGPLAGVEGTLTKVKNAHRIVVSVTLLQRSVSAEIDSGWVEAAPALPPGRILVPARRFMVA